MSSEPAKKLTSANRRSVTRWHALDDELFIRTTTGMQPTARALAMAGMVREALKSLEAAIELPRFTGLSYAIGR